MRETQMSKDLEKKVTEWALWYHHNKYVLRNEDLDQKVNFLARAVDGCMACVADAMNEINKINQRRTIVLPRDYNG